MEGDQSGLFASRLDPVPGRRRIAGGEPSAGIGQCDQAAVRRVGQKQWPPTQRRRGQAAVGGIPRLGKAEEDSPWVIGGSESVVVARTIFRPRRRSPGRVLQITSRKRLRQRKIA